MNIATSLYDKAKKQPLFRNCATKLLSTPWIINSQPYQALENKLIDHKHKKLEKQPLQLLHIEVTNYCNAACIMCPNPTMTRIKAFMNDEIYNQSILQAASSGIKTISIVSIGEPFLDKKLASRVQAAKKLGLKVIVSTNGSLLKPQIANDIINSGLDELHISIDGHTKQTYESIRIGLNFDQVLSNVRQFMHARKASHNKHPKVMIRCVGLKQNQNELKSFQKFWHNIVDDCIVSHTHDWAGGVSKNFRGAFHSATLRRVPCRLIWKELMVHHDGTVIACCHDYEGTLKVGDIKHQPLTEIWNGKQLFLLRQAHLSRNLSGLPTCAKCHVNSVWWG